MRRLTESLSTVSLQRQVPPSPGTHEQQPRPPAASALKSVEAQAAELAQLYLPDDTAERRGFFTQIYLASQSLEAPPGDLLVLRAYFLHDGRVEEAVKYLRAFAYLSELGFQEEQINTALLLHKNHLDEALDYLMKNN